MLFSATKVEYENESIIDFYNIDEILDLSYVIRDRIFLNRIWPIAPLIEKKSFYTHERLNNGVWRVHVPSWVKGTICINILYNKNEYEYQKLFDFGTDNAQGKSEDLTKTGPCIMSVRNNFFYDEFSKKTSLDHSIICFFGINSGAMPSGIQRSPLYKDVNGAKKVIGYALGRGFSMVKDIDNTNLLQDETGVLFYRYIFKDGVPSGPVYFELNPQMASGSIKKIGTKVTFSDNFVDVDNVGTPHDPWHGFEKLDFYKDRL